MVVVKVLLFIITIFVIVVVNLYDFDNLLKGEEEYIQIYSGFLFTLGMLAMFPVILNINLIRSIIILYILYIVFYTWVYIKIKKWKKENSSNKNERGKDVNE